MCYVDCADEPVGRKNMQGWNNNTLMSNWQKFMKHINIFSREVDDFDFTGGDDVFLD